MTIFLIYTQSFPSSTSFAELHRSYISRQPLKESGLYGKLDYMIYNIHLVRTDEINYTLKCYIGRIGGTII